MANDEFNKTSKVQQVLTVKWEHWTWILLSLSSSHIQFQRSKSREKNCDGGLASLRSVDKLFISRWSSVVANKIKHYRESYFAKWGNINWCDIWRQMSVAVCSEVVGQHYNEGLQLHFCLSVGHQVLPSSLSALFVRDFLNLVIHSVGLAL